MNNINNLEKSKNAHSYRKVALAACFGTFLEWYDFLTFATLAVAFSPLFFPSSDPSTGLLASLATFGVGMVVRPIGAAFFGSLGDRIGRKPVFIVTITIMGLATVCVGFLPTYAQIGIWAPILLVFLRLLQGLSAGGEIGGSAVYLTEHAGSKNRGFKTSFLQLMGPLGILFSTLQIALLRNYLTPEEFQSWGWRVPFWVSIVLLAIAFKARMSLEETPVYLELMNKNQRSESPLLENFKDPKTRKHMFLLFFCVSAGGAILFFCIQVYSSIYLKTSTKIPAEVVDQLSIYGTISLLFFTVFAGWLSDKIGRKPVVASGLVLGAALILPAFELLNAIGNNASNQNNSNYLLALILIGLSAILGLVVGPQTALLAELFPAKSRNSAATLPHNLAAGWVGGLLPLIVTLINREYENPTAGLWYPTAFLICAAVTALIYLPETRKVNLNI
ncbi:MFS transporter [Polynucleobacter asymbioticus]|uniref:Sugar transporter n=1 Tax=Polynucleobacter asymbioticus TaxID=576611 RepID=A0AAC9IPC4_9BURK|nr:MFS transporter [Polynucleobacter asymbioticus]APB97993.1 sugar transporter [Polynucleobacter asymbioticus]APC00279.1 sugar transporter [Polynucleobacter asymbioticus]